MIKKLFNDDSGITVAVESIILFSISILLLGMIFTTFQGLTQKQDKILIEEELKKIGNTIARQMSDMEVEASASNTMGSHTTIKTEFQIPDRIGDSSYKIIFLDGVPGKLILESSGDPYVRVEVPVHERIRLADNSTIYSMDDKFSIEYDSLSSRMFFTNGGVIPFPDFNAPTISFESPDEGVNISNSTYINTTTWDDVRVTRVEFYVNDDYRYSAGEPYDWLWDTREEIDGNYTVTAIAYDAAANFKIVIRNFTIYNPFPYPPRISEISPPDLSSTDFKKPIIKAKITDNNPLNISSINLTVDGVNVTANSTISYITFPKVAVISYTPLWNLENGTHIVNLSLSDLDPTIPLVYANWSFNVTNVTNTSGPTANIIRPASSASLISGTLINGTYEAYDMDSGIDYIVINVTRGDGLKYPKYYENISIYPDVVYEIPPEAPWILGNYYVDGMNYTYNLTVFDRSGRSVSDQAGPFTVNTSGQASNLLIDKSGSNTINSKCLNGTKVSRNPSTTVKIVKITVVWDPDNMENITNVWINSISRWTGSNSSGSQLDISDYTAGTSKRDMNMCFNASIQTKTFTISFLLDDFTTKTINIP